jgi:hypothetical protein
LIFVNGSSFSFLNLDIQFSKQQLLERLSFLCHMFLPTFSNVRLAWLHGFISGSSILFHWSSCLLLFHYHTVFIAVALQYILKSCIVIPIVLFFLLSMLCYSACKSILGFIFNIYGGYHLHLMAIALNM